MSRLLNWIRREAVDRLTGQHEKRQEAIKADREARELRLERRQLKWLGKKVAREHAKTKDRSSTTDQLVGRAMSALPDRPLGSYSLKEHEVRYLHALAGDRTEEQDAMLAAHERRQALLALPAKERTEEERAFLLGQPAPTQITEGEDRREGQLTVNRPQPPAQPTEGGGGIVLRTSPELAEAIADEDWERGSEVVDALTVQAADEHDETERHLAELHKSPISDRAIIARVEGPEALAEADRADRQVSDVLDDILKRPKGGAALETANIPRGGMSPAQRGGFTPTPEEYAKEIVPAYIETGEELERWRELRRSEKAFKKACEKRDARPGAAVCHGVKLLEKGHVWWKVPGRAQWECVECGRNVPTMYFDLRRGTLVDIRGGMFTRDVTVGLAMLASGEGGRLIGDTSALAKRLMAPLEDGEPNPHAPLGRALQKYAAHGGLHVDIQTEDAFYVELEGDYDVCANCGMAKSSHKDEAFTRASTIAGAPEVVDHMLRCPIHGRDAT